MIEIKNIDGEVIYSSSSATSLSDAVSEAVSKGVSLSRANLDGANLSRANLHGANLSRANLDGANLYGANLYGANLYGANLYGAGLYGAGLYGAKGVISFGPCPGAGRIGYAVDHTDNMMVQLGCFWGDESEAIEAISVRYKDNQITRDAYIGIVSSACNVLRARR